MNVVQGTWYGILPASCLLSAAQTALAGPKPQSASGLSAYAEPRFRGERIFIAASTPDLKAIGFDNRIRSLRVVGGLWDVCTDPGYRGRCMQVTGEIVSFAGTGLDSKVSSIRRLDEPAPETR